MNCIATPNQTDYCFSINVDMLFGWWNIVIDPRDDAVRAAVWHLCINSWEPSHRTYTICLVNWIVQIFLLNSLNENYYQKNKEWTDIFELLWEKFLFGEIGVIMVLFLPTEITDGVLMIQAFLFIGNMNAQKRDKPWTQQWPFSIQSYFDFVESQLCLLFWLLQQLLWLSTITITITTIMSIIWL